MMELGPTMGIIASSAARKKGGPVDLFLKKHLGILCQHHILTTEGTYDDLLKKHEEHLSISKLRPGFRGGVIELAEKIVTSSCQTLLFFSDPNDLRADSPENQTLIRQSIVHDVELLQNVWSANIWAEKNNSCIGLSLSQQTVSLIAHDKKKETMYKFVAEHQIELNAFKSIFCTGTTGKNISTFFPSLKDKITAFNSGPLGGDVQIANEIIEGRCHHVVFLMDPLSAHPHDSDIRLFSRVCHEFEGVFVNFMVTERSATRWINTVKGELCLSWT